MEEFAEKYRPMEEIFKEWHEDPEYVKELDRAKRALAVEIRLYELRAELGVTQQQIASALGVSQASVSEFEHRDDITLSRLERYLAALGGEMRISARFADRTVELDL